ncbi:stage II sporulation protein M [Elizabethkingia anophelis]|uniref:stage II sporulation protein M n=1 Tax=Elizabethkingia anophelis TaxID=1117645 RepID=UPI002010D383|nr:stage II sporulation protein M [Elizabethkingia anophelis]EJC8059213.1 stage II sporulation protein M [Elizabethkingia anophelis]MCL1641680.1 stage II sporulation protein M [Elizabethkingia anophelis]MCL1644225.1 stage II sporulation protein M [Elizabethkingia anophelis]MCT3926315.1 stage II sporulation protein M [Elizabethkingia anophelis]MCT4100788.1 stage II sporulation protein M [Elizabethkingia anophelis]
MREIAFIKQNKEKWLDIEQVVLGKIKKNPDDLSSLYINLINDLSFSQTYYPKSKTTVYLNYLSSQIFQKIYKTKRIEQNRLKAFFMKEVPLIMYEYRKYLLLAFLVFAMFTTIGVISTHYDLDFVKLILGEDYVNQTLENIKKGNAVAIYGSGSNWGSAIGIIQNNLGVGAKLYAYGIFGGVGTLLVLMQNSIMLGTFQYFFQQQGVLGDSMRGIWIHGAFEISAMVIEATAGFILGASLLFPKTYSRLNSFKIGFRNSFKIFVSTIPFTIFAGILEGFVTRYALQMPLIIDLVIIFGTLGFIIFYYAIFPYRVHKKLKHDAIL